MKAAGPLIFAAAIAAAVLISVSGIRCYAVLTGSMEPVLPVGSLLVVVPMSFDELKVGQDITYKTAGGTVTHRIVAIDQAARTVTTQGLTNNVADTPVTAENIVGRVQLCLPWMGYPVKILNQGAIPSLPVMIQLIKVCGLPVERYFNPEIMREESEQRQRVSHKLKLCPEEYLPIIEGAIDGALKMEQTAKQKEDA